MTKLKHVRNHITYANVVATMALFIALGGTSFAASTALRKNSVGTAQIRAGAVHSKQIHNKSVLPADLNSSTIKLFRGMTGPAGPAGPPGPAATKYWESVDATGGRQHGTANSAGHAGSPGVYSVGFADSVANCAPIVSADGSSGAGVYANASVQGTTVAVHTFDAASNPVDVGFYLAVYC